MNNELISVMMSTYNETAKELAQSVDSILNQTYQNIEFIIVNDNPANIELDGYLKNIKDSRVILVKNEVNLGLVKSLNKALSFAKGEYVARMDADDISMPDRLEKEISHLKTNCLDIVGTDIQLIDDNDVVIKERMRFPATDTLARKYINYGNCMAHPTWLVKKEVYEKLGGYRDVKSCEDYDFLIRLLFSTNFKVGNISQIGLKYRIRNSGVSKSSEARQFVLRSFIAKNKEHIKDISQERIDEYLASNVFKKEVSLYEKYKADKEKAKQDRNIDSVFHVLTNKYFYIIQIEKYYLKKRDKDK